MIAFKVLLNGEIVFIAGQEDVSILHANVVLSRDNQERGVRDYIRLNTSGLSQDTEAGYPEHFRWKERNLAVGDTIEIRVVETSKIDDPVKRYRSDSSVQENPFTEEELREMRYKDYLQLKKEFEPHGAA